MRTSWYPQRDRPDRPHWPLEEHRWQRSGTVFIGMDMNEQKIRKLVDSCLLTDKEMIGDWTDVPNPLKASSEKRISLQKAKSKQRKPKSKRRGKRRQKIES